MVAISCCRTFRNRSYIRRYSLWILVAFFISSIFVLGLFVQGPSHPPDDTLSVKSLFVRDTKRRILQGDVFHMSPHVSCPQSGVYDPLEGAKLHIGSPHVYLPKDLRIRNGIKWDYKLNANASDKIPLNRDIPDVRPEQCKKIIYDNHALPNMTIVIPFYNEVASLLLRTVHSILTHTPYYLVHEIIIVDDDSMLPNLMEPLDRYIAELDPKIRLIRNTERQGLIRTRQRGADLATGEVLVFMDSHVEVNIGWAQPLLQAFVDNPRVVLQPGLQNIQMDTIMFGANKQGKVDKPNMGRTTFGWDLSIRWMGPRAGDAVDRPFPVPSFMGCALAVKRDWFYKLGAFDTAMDLWGGENMELAFRAWLCGGSAMTHPCSRIGHLFRPLPYGGEATEKNIARNLARIAEVWMEGYQHLFYAAQRPLELSDKDWEAVEKRRKVKQDLKCKDFSWILQNVVPDMPIPPHDATMYGRVFDPKVKGGFGKKDGGCLAAPDGNVRYAAGGSCSHININIESIFYVSTSGGFHHKDNSHCLLPINEEEQDRNNKPIELRVGICPDPHNEPKGKWAIKDEKFTSRSKDPHRITYYANNLNKMFCLTRGDKNNGPRKIPDSSVTLQKCKNNAANQELWGFDYNFDGAVTKLAGLRQLRQLEQGLKHNQQRIQAAYAEPEKIVSPKRTQREKTLHQKKARHSWDDRLKIFPGAPEN